jgi:hypothetical protein
MKFDMSSPPASEAPRPVHSLDSVAYEVTDRLSATGEDFARRYPEIRSALAILQEPATTPEHREMIRQFGETIIAANQEPTQAAPTPDQRPEGQFFDITALDGRKGADGQ